MVWKRYFESLRVPTNRSHRPLCSFGNLHPRRDPTASPHPPSLTAAHSERSRPQHLMATCLVTAVPVRDGHSTSQHDPVREPPGHPTDVAPAPAPGRDPALELTWHPRGLQRAKHEAKIGKSSQRTSDFLNELVKELEKAASGTDRDTVEKEELQEGGRHAVTPSHDKTGAIRSTGVPVLSNPGEAHHARAHEVFEKNAGAGDKRNSNAVDPADFQKYCIEGAVAVLGSMLFGMVLCGALCLWRKRRRRLSAASGAQPDSRPAHPSTPKRQTRHQQPPSVPGGPAPARPDGRPPRPPPPRTLWLSNSTSQLLRNGPAPSGPRRN